MLISRMDGLCDLRRSCCTAVNLVFVSNLGPESAIRIAPVGAVIIMDNMHTIMIFVAYSNCLDVWSSVTPNITGPNAA